ncbi:hypothetical protein A2480_00805 [Candidatus Uhrbacteria bacterium RIFOXYC2_FULL_47_19]|uniref:VCBS repeat-containing protein n=1 Tax=Candidatus Uhrbacteria bacterium RIFOXYC2_FULL_47_19 TaxID=1802424 RepID=A0A1F7WFJ4_9BACT|nr:MAG: hypothetical protein A2480_00805 [Candidatus Uhrbacteria bacterium RIFOXYC2_FULL_47_19]
MFSWCRKPKSDGTVFFLFIAGLGTIILASAVLGTVLDRRLAVGDDPDIVALLARGSSNDEVTGIEKLAIEPTSDTLSVYAYVVDGQRRVALVGWDRQAGSYRLYDDSILRFDGALRVELESENVAMRDGTQVIKISAGSQIGESVAWIGVKEATLFIYSICSQDEICGQTMVVSDPDRLTIQDVTGDGQAELLVGRSNETSNFDVYSWHIDRLQYDQSLTVALNSRSTMFPEP